MIETTKKVLLIIKPGYIIEKNLVGKIIDHLERNELKILNLKKVFLNLKQAGEFYWEHHDRPFFLSLIKSMSDSPVIVICLETNGTENAIKIVRSIVGNTDPLKAEVGTIRRMYGENKEANAVHCSDSFSSAEREISFFFQKHELFE